MKKRKNIEQYCKDIKNQASLQLTKMLLIVTHPSLISCQQQANIISRNSIEIPKEPVYKHTAIDVSAVPESGTFVNGRIYTAGVSYLEQNRSKDIA